MPEHATTFIVTMNVLPIAKKAAILKALTDGASIRSTARITGVSKATILRLLVEVGEFCSIYQGERFYHLPCTRVEFDGIWAYVGAKQKNAKHEGQGDIWTHTALCPDTKLMVTWYVGAQGTEDIRTFMRDLAGRFDHRISLSSDGSSFYAAAVEEAFGYQSVDYGQIIKYFKAGQPSTGRYSPPECTGVDRKTMLGRPDVKKISTSYVERSNFHLRMNARRFTRLTNGFSRKAENHAHAVSMHFMAYNYVRPHGTLTKAAKGVHTTPAMAAGLTDHVWTWEEALDLMNPVSVTIK